LQQRAVVRLFRVVDDLDGLGVPRVVAVGGVAVLTAAVTDAGADDAGLLANQILHAPKASARQNRRLVGHDVDSFSSTRPMSTYRPGSWFFQCCPVNGGSVPLCWATGSLVYWRITLDGSDASISSPSTTTDRTCSSFEL